MISTLRKKVTAIVVVLVGLVLAAMLAYSYWSSYTMQWGLVDESLDRGLTSDEFMPVIGGAPLASMPGDNRVERSDTEEFDDAFGGQSGLLGVSQDFRGAGGGRLVARVMVTWDGTVISTSDATLVDADVLNEVIQAVLSTDEDDGRLSDVHVAWKSDRKYGAGCAIAIADTSDVDELLYRQALTSLAAFFGGIVALFIIVWPLSAYILRPVERAWIQQRHFVSDASHELKTPLAVIRANMGILSQDSSLSAQSRRWVDSTSAAAKQMQGLVGELLELARTDESGAGDLSVMNHRDIDFSDLVENATLEFDARAFEQGCSIESDIASDIHLKGDEEWLKRMVTILVDNAVKYAQKQSSVQVKLVRSSHIGSASHVALSVTNQGTPIAAEDLPHVFDRFYRSDAARSRSTGGYGLGLAIAKGIAEAHGGSIAVASDESSGTTFTVRL